MRCDLGSYSRSRPSRLSTIRLVVASNDNASSLVFRRRPLGRSPASSDASHRQVPSSRNVGLKLRPVGPGSIFVASIADMIATQRGLAESSQLSQELSQVAVAPRAEGRPKPVRTDIVVLRRAPRGRFQSRGGLAFRGLRALVVP